MGIPIFEALHLIHDEHVGLQTAEYLNVVGGTIIGDNLVRFWTIVGILSLEMISLYNKDLGISELFDFTALLVFQGGRAEDEYRADESFFYPPFGKDRV